MSFNLLRNSRMFFTTNVDTATGVVGTTGFTTANTYEIQVLDGLAFSQSTTSETVTINEAGGTPVRGQRSFNTALEPVDFSFSTYIRPADGGTNITAEEGVLWNALLAKDAIGGTAPAWTEAPSVATAVATNSNVNQLQKFGLIIDVDGVSYIIDNCALDSATLDFGLDAIAMVQWAGKGTKMRSITGLTLTTAAGTVTFGGGTYTGSAKAKNASAPYIANKLSTISLKSGIGGSGSAYTLAITGGQLTISNNLTYLTPANLGIVNQPITYFTGTRAISGNVTAYLRSGATSTQGLLNDMLTASTTDVNPAYEIIIAMGGSTSATRVELELNSAVLQIPTVETEQVVSTTINFTAQSSTAGAFDISAANELEVRYYTTNA